MTNFKKANKVRRRLSIIGIMTVLFLGLSFTRYEPKATITEPQNPVFSVESMAYTNYFDKYLPFSDVYNGVTNPTLTQTYVIENAVDLYHFSLACSGDEKEIFLSLNYILGKDIDYTEASRNGFYFRPIGFHQHPNPNTELTPTENEAANPYAFQGDFDGQGFEISNLYVHQISEADYSTIYGSALVYYSMFSVVGEEGSVHHLGLINPTLTASTNIAIMTKSSHLVGANHGNINHVYVIDNRTGAAAGLNVSGAYFHLSGLVVDNYGSISNAFFAGEAVKSTSVSANLSTSLVVRTNSGTLTRVYYDSSIYLSPIPGTELGTSLKSVVNATNPTNQFQTVSNFSTEWFYNLSYGSGFRPSNTYPILQGFKTATSIFYLNRAADIVYMAKMIDATNLQFRTAVFQLQRDIDMSSVSRSAYRPPTAIFSGTIENQTATVNIVPNDPRYLFDRETGENANFSILNLHVETGIDLGVYAGYGLFGVLSGRVQNINFGMTTLLVKNPELFATEQYVAAGMVAARLQNGSITNVVMDADISIPQSPSLDATLPRVYVGGLIGTGNGTITTSNTFGSLRGGIHNYDSKSFDSALGGFAGFAGVPGTTNPLLIQTSNNRMEVTGPAFLSGGVGSQTLLGGFVGSGLMNRFFNVTNYADIVSHDANGFLDQVYMGGLIGYQTHLAPSSNTHPTGMNNEGDLILNLNQAMKARMAAGYGIAANTLAATARNYYDIMNWGSSTIVVPVGTTFDDDDLDGMDIQIAGIVIGYFLSNATFHRLWNYADVEIDLSFVSAYAGIALLNNSFYSPIPTSVTDFRLIYNNVGESTPPSNATNTFNYANNLGHIDGTTSTQVRHKQIKIAGVLLGRQAHGLSLRNTGNISITMNHDALSALTSANSTDLILNQQKNIIIAGVTEEISFERKAENLYNGGLISMVANPSAEILFHVNLSGIAHRNRNTRTLTTGNIAKQLLNDGYVSFQGKITGNVRVSGIVTFNRGVIHSSINSGDLYAANAIQENPSGEAENDFLIDVGGIAAVNPTNLTSILMNALNYGDIVAYSTTPEGQVAAGGILARNNRREDISIPMNQASDQHYLAILRNTINYGNIYTWNGRPEKLIPLFLTPDLMAEPYAVSGGLMGVGLLRMENSINYGGVYSSTLSGGIVGLLDLYSFAKHWPVSAVVMTNLINYGKVRPLLSPEAFSFSANTNEGIDQNPGQIQETTATSGNRGFGGILGDIFVGPTDWNFSTGNMAFTMNSNGYKRFWLNFDSQANVIGQMPNVSVVSDTLASNLSSFVYTTKRGDTENPGDTTPYPYANVRSYSLLDTPGQYGNGIDGTAAGWIFDAASFPFMNPSNNFPGIYNNIRLIPTNRVNSHLLTKIGVDFNPNDLTRGIFALGPNTGIGEAGLYMPDNWDFNLLNPFNGNSDWRNIVVSGGESLSTKINYGMKQLSLSLATNIVTLQLVDANNPSIKLTNPVVDLVNDRITFYVSNNSLAAAGAHDVEETFGYYPAGPEFADKYFAQFVGGVWVGPYEWDEVTNSYVEKTGGTHVRIPITIINSVSPKQFVVNTTDSYLLGYRATFFYKPTPEAEPQTMNSPAKILNSFGPYNSAGFIVGVNNSNLDNANLNYGSIRVFSEAYVHDPNDPIGDPFTYKNYQIRIIRIADQELPQLNSILVNGVSAMPEGVIDVHDVNVASSPLHFKSETVDNLVRGRMIIQYQTINVPFGTQPHISAQVLDSNNDAISTTLYTLPLPTSVQTQNGYNPITGTWAAGTLTYTFTVNPQMPAGNYTLVLTIGTNQVHSIRFSKAGSTDTSITELTVQSGYTTIKNDKKYTTEIRFGMFYNPLDPNTTKILNFTNLPSLTNITSEQIVANTSLYQPSYLATFRIAPYATLVSATVTVNPNPIEGYRNEYTITYIIKSELNTYDTYTHVMTEQAVNLIPTAVYKGVNPITNSIFDIKFNREEAPTYTYEYPLTSVYRYQSTHTQTFSVTFSEGVEGGKIPTNGVEYSAALLTTGFTIAFSDEAPIGKYQVTMLYQETYEYTNPSYPLYGKVFQWNLQYSTPIIQKYKNANSLLKSISFSSDAAYARGDIIIHSSIIDETMYDTLISFPTQREIMLLPTGIEYNLQIDKKEFYIIGQVSKTNLSFYVPSFDAPIASLIVRMNPDGTPADSLVADFSPIIGSGFVFVWYRIYAEDYIEGDEITGLHYTDYRIAVQDVSRSVYLTVQVHADLDAPFDWAYISFRLVQEELAALSISFYSYFDGVDTLGVNAPLVNTSAGMFYVYINLPSGYTFTIEVNNVVTGNPAFFIPYSVVSRSYIVKITIVEDVEEDADWGQNLIEFFTPEA